MVKVATWRAPGRGLQGPEDGEHLRVTVVRAGGELAMRVPTICSQSRGRDGQPEQELGRFPGRHAQAAFGRGCEAQPGMNEE